MYIYVYLAKGTMNSPRMFPFGPYDIYDKSEMGQLSTLLDTNMYMLIRA